MTWPTPTGKQQHISDRKDNASQDPPTQGWGDSPSVAILCVEKKKQNSVSGPRKAC